MPPDAAPDAAPAAMVLRRHRLARLHARAWDDILAREWDPVARDCIGHWAAHGLPLVTTTQREAVASADEAPVSLGLAAPLQWQRRRLALQVPRAAIASQGEFPEASAIVESLPAGRRPAFAALAGEVARSGADMRVFGSHGWQHLTGLAYLREGSDIDLCIGVTGAGHADEVAARLSDFPEAGPRLDGELMFADGDAVHWREWAAWRRGAVNRLLVKRLHGSVLARTFPAETADA